MKAALKPVWDMQRTRKLVSILHGKDSFEPARRSMASTIDRREYARYHYSEIKMRWDRLKKTAVTSDQKWDLIWESEIDGKDQHVDIHAIAANTVACLQSLHAIPDILAHALYYSLGLDSATKLNERAINVSSVKKLLVKNSTHANLAGHLEEAARGGGAQFLSAITNHSKHRSAVKNSISLDLSEAETDSEPLRLLFAPFQYDTKYYESRDVLPFLESEFNRVSKLVVDTGIELNNFLEADLAQLRLLAPLMDDGARKNDVT